MPRFIKAHWEAPTIMLLCFLCGMGLTLAHHLFNANLQGKPVPTGDYRLSGFLLSKQQFNVSMGTGFAFFVRVFLSIAASATYVQVLWRSILKARRPTLAELDWAFAGLDNVFGLLNFKRGRKYPVLMILAIIFWTVPIATIFPPATLLVESSSSAPVSLAEVPVFDFTSMNFASPMLWRNFGGGNYPAWKFEGPSQPLQKLATAVMGLGAILPIPHPVSNMSWSQDFWGPALRCQNITGHVRDDIFLNIWNSYDQREGPNTGSYGFLSWVPWSCDLAGLGECNATGDLPWTDLPFPYVHPSTNTKTPRQGPSVSPFAGAGPATTWIAIVPQAIDFDVQYGTHVKNQTRIVWRGDKGHGTKSGSGCVYRQLKDLHSSIDCVSSHLPTALFEDASLLRCDLLNTSYSVNFNYVDGRQDVGIKSNTTGHSMVLNGSALFSSADIFIKEDSMTVDEHCDNFLAGSHKRPGFIQKESCVFDVSAMRLLAYQSIFAAFNQLVLGSAYSEYNKRDIVKSTNIMSTVLGETVELAFLRRWRSSALQHNLVNDGSFQDYNLAAMMSNSSIPAYQGLSNGPLPTGRMDLKSSLENLFQNLTISLLAEPYLQPNFSSPFAPPQWTNVTRHIYQNVYTYNRTMLWLAYGLANAFTAVAVLGGMFALSSNGASYSDNFSTILRISRTAKLTVEIGPQDGSGHDPLPEYLKAARLDLGRTCEATAMETCAAERSKLPGEQQSRVG